MLMYFLIGLLLVLVGVAGLQFSYMSYIERIYKERRAYLRELERKHARLTEKLAEAERRVAEQDELLNSLMPDRADDVEMWADVIEER